MHRSRSWGVASPFSRRCIRPRSFASATASVLLVIAMIAAASGCASSMKAPPPVARQAPSRPPPEPSPAPTAPAVVTPDTVSTQEAEDLAAVQAERYEGPVGSSNEDLDEELEEFLSDESETILTERVDFDIPIVMNERVDYYIDYFQRRVRSSFEKWLARAPQIVPYLRARFRQEGLPEDLIYISLIESGFSPLATSRANAVGYWQFIASTGRRYGLRIDRWVDERRDLELSTEAAIAYLKDLHEMFGSWYLAAAAYNSGEGRIQRAIERYGSEDLWELSEFSYLREETKDYVPKLIAATMIAREPERYGFTNVRPLPAAEVDVVSVPPSTHLARVAEGAETTEETIRTLNPQLRGRATPPGGDTSVRIPRGAGQSFSERFAAARARPVPVERTHVVRRGESPSAIARRYGVSTRELMELNGIRNARHLRAGQRLRLPPPPGGWPDERAAAPAAPLRRPDEARPTELARVEGRVAEPPAESADEAPPDTSAASPVADGAVTDPGAPAAADAGLPDVAGAAAAPSGDAAAGAGGSASAAPAGGSADPESPPPWLLVAPPAPIREPVRYTVRPGDTVYTIARAHGLSVLDIERANPGALAQLVAGQELDLRPPTSAAHADAPGGDPGGSEDAIVHRVAPGDTLWSIARQHGVTAQELREWNDLEGTAVQVGQRLVVFPSGT